MEGLGTSNSLKNYDPDRCIICLSKVSLKLGDDDSRMKGVGAKEKNLQKIAPKSVVKSPGFLTTFNGIWEVFHQNKSGSNDDIFLESLLTTGRSKGSKKATFSKAPTFCKPCCQKVVAVENLIKALKRQVGEIKTLLEESRRKAGKEQWTTTTNDEEDEENAADLKDEEDEWHWQEHVGSKQMKPQPPQQLAVSPIDLGNFSNSSVKSDPETTTAMMECEGGEEEDEDDSNWAWDDDDPDYIKSEEDDNVNDEYEYDEEYSSEDEEPLDDNLNEGVTVTTGSDPLEIPASSSSSTNQQNSEMTIICDVKGCGRKFKAMSGLYKHQKTCHPTPAQQLVNLEKLKKKAESQNPSSSSSASSSSLKIFTCDLEACNRKCASKIALLIHQKQCHLKLMIALGRIKDPSQNKFPCSCGQAFPSQTARYGHQRRNKTTHPEFQFKLRDLRTKMEDGQLCDLCDEPVKLTNILEHLTNHLEGQAEYVVKCPNFEHCGQMFTHSKRLHEGHFKSQRFWNTCKKVAQENKFDLSCETCGFSTDQRIRLPTHLTNEHERGTLEKNLKCPISGCGKMFAVKQSIYFHLHAHRSKRITTQVCKHCLGTIKIEEMEVHLKEEHGIGEVIGCTKCPLKFSGRDEMVEHLWEHRYVGLNCDICGDQVTFGRYSEIRDHYAGVHGICPKKFKCGEGGCNKLFWRRGELRRHKAENHKGEGEIQKKKKRFCCELCFEDVSFTSEITLISHKIKVHGEEPFRCDICGETFHHKVVFSRHRKEHAGVVFKKEWRCEVEGCGKIFKEKSNWKRHVESGHKVDADKPFKCEECGKGFTSANGLVVHRDSVHLGLRPWVCDECGERFSSSSVLKRHKLIHSGERPFGCEVCGQRFRHKEVLRRHLVGHEEKGAGFKPNGPMKQIRKRKHE